MSERFFGPCSLALVMLVATSQVQADFVIKRIKCEEATNAQPRTIFTNTSGETRTISTQVTKDGCSPKASGGFLIVRSTGNAGTVLSRGGYSNVVQLNVVSQGTAQILFVPNNGPVRGTFDVQFEID